MESVSNARTPLIAIFVELLTRSALSAKLASLLRELRTIVFPLPIVQQLQDFLNFQSQLGKEILS